MNRILRSSVQKVGLLTRNVASPNTVSSVRTNASLMKPTPDIVYYGGVTIFFAAYALRGMNNYRKREEAMIQFADEM